MPYAAAVFDVQYGLYGQPWGRLIRAYPSGDPHRHPAKYSRKLIYWILSRGIERGYWRPGDALLDPMAGIGCGGIAAADLGLGWVGVELEPVFVETAEENFLLHYERWAGEGKPFPRVIQGDSRNLTGILEGRGLRGCGAVMSPPYGNRVDDHGPEKEGYRVAGNVGVYGRSEGQIGALSGSVVSPPYGDVRLSADANFQSREKPHRPAAAEVQATGYGTAPGQVGGSVMSPPFSEPETRSRYASQEGEVMGMLSRAYTEASTQAGSPGQIAAHSPRKDTYWETMREIYSQVAAALPRGAVFTVVIKDYVRQKRIVPICAQTADLIESCGFSLFEVTRAMVYSVDPKTGEMKAHKSMFRRIKEDRGEIPSIDYEEVQWYRKV